MWPVAVNPPSGGPRRSFTIEHITSRALLPHAGLALECPYGLVCQWYSILMLVGYYCPFMNMCDPFHVPPYPGQGCGTRHTYVHIYFILARDQPSGH